MPRFALAASLAFLVGSPANFPAFTLQGDAGSRHFSISRKMSRSVIPSGARDLLFAIAHTHQPNHLEEKIP